MWRRTAVLLRPDRSVKRGKGGLMRTVVVFSLCSLVGILAGFSVAGGENYSDSPYGAWMHGPPQDPDYFPIAVWLQAPEDAAAYKKAGINLYVGLWEGPTEEQLAHLKAAGMQTI